MPNREKLIYVGDGIRVPEPGELVGTPVHIDGRRGVVVANDGLTITVEWHPDLVSECPHCAEMAGRMERQVTAEGFEFKRLSSGEWHDIAATFWRLKDVASLFGKGGYRNGIFYEPPWRELDAYLHCSKERYHSALFNGNPRLPRREKRWDCGLGPVRVNAATLAGRTLITLAWRDGCTFSLTGIEGEPERGCDIASIDASIVEAVLATEFVVMNWDIHLFHPDGTLRLA